MAVFPFQLCGVLWVTLGLSLANRDTNIRERTCKYNGSIPETMLELTHTRFVAARRGSMISFHCTSAQEASWYKKSENGKDQELTNSSRIHLATNGSVMTLCIEKVEHTDNGIYFCKGNNSHGDGKTQPWCCGTELRVLGVSTYQQVRDRHLLKDAIILIQTILLVLFLSMPLLLTRGKGGSKDISHEDHTYEGLTVEMADTYEDIGTYQDKAEKWNLGEQPSEE